MPTDLAKSPQPYRSVMFFCFDGVDGAGKSTQIRLFCDWLRDQSYQVVTCRDPGSTRLGESVRALVLNPSDIPIHRKTEMLLYMTARAQLVEEVVRPALQAGKMVVSDRYLLANVVYQGYAGGLDLESIWSVGRVTVEDIMPDLIFVLDIDPEISVQRIDRAADRMESQGVKYLQLVRNGFLAEAAKDPQRVVVLDANRSISAVQDDLRAAARLRLQRRSP